MSNKEWFIVTTKAEGFPYTVYRYAIEYWLLPSDGFDDEESYKKWFDDLGKYFVERTAIKEEVVAIEPAQFLSAYSMVKES